MLSDEDLGKRIREEIKDLSELFDILTEDLMAISLRKRETNKRQFILSTAEDVEGINTKFADIKAKLFEKM